MAELSASDVETYTGGRLPASDPETQRMLDAALTEARHSVGWHVSPVLTAQTITMDGPGGYKLRLPTQKIVTLNSIANDGVDLDLVNDVVQSAQVGWLLVKKTGCWSYKYSGISINMDHGFTEDEASDWRQAILSMVDDMSTVKISGRADGDLSSKQVDDVVYKWGNEGYTSIETILQKYRLMWGWA